MLEQTVEGDVLVVGAGLAGITAAIWAARCGANVLLASSGPVCSGSSFYPGTWGLGLVGPEDEQDETDLAETILKVGEGMADPKLVRFLASEIRQGIRDLRKMGVSLKEAENKSEKEFIPCFDHKNRDWHGIVKESAKPAFQRELKRLNVTELPFTTVTDLLIKNGQIAGAGAVRQTESFGKKDGGEGIGLLGCQFLSIRCPAVILAGGGLGGLFSRRLNTDDVTGIPQYLALKAGAFLVNLEFMQMMPGFITPAPKTIYNEKVFRYSEFTDPETGGSIFSDWDEKELAERMEIRSAHGPFTCRLGSGPIDIRLFQETRKHSVGVRLSYKKELREHQPEFIRTYFNWLLKEKGLTIDDPVQIGIFAHASNGGIQINCEGSCNVPGLYACGECTGGMHGADRLGGLSTANGLVFGKSAGIHGAAWSRKAKGLERPISGPGSVSDIKAASEQGSFALSGPKTNHEFEAEMSADSKAASWGKTWIMGAEKLLDDLRQVNLKAAMVVRCEKDLAWALDQVERIRSEAGSRRESFQTVEEFMAAVPDAGKQYVCGKQLEGALELSEAMLRAIEQRKDSRGSHYREDYPEKEDKFRYPIRVGKQNGKLQLSFDTGEAEQWGGVSDIAFCDN